VTWLDGWAADLRILQFVLGRGSTGQRLSGSRFDRFVPRVG
jgi:hypothetical protein